MKIIEEDFKLKNEIRELVNSQFSDSDVATRFLQRLEQGELTRDENSKSHLCAYFSAYDSIAKQVFIGHHKKSGLWLFSGGHIDQRETVHESVIREVGEEWGLNGNDFEINPPELLTITEINNPTKQKCNLHYDLWHFVSVDKNKFKPVDENLLEEFHEAGWKSLEEARSLIKDKNTLSAIDFIESKF